MSQFVAHQESEVMRYNIKQYYYALLLIWITSICMVKYLSSNDLFFIVIILYGFCAYACQLALFISARDQNYDLYRVIGLSLGVLTGLGLLAYTILALSP
jgi:hypothetical protein